jgi:tetratricopeptide (TPR) repeat protein
MLPSAQPLAQANPQASPLCVVLKPQAGLAAAMGTFAAGLYLPHGGPPSVVQYVWAAVASVVAGGLTVLQLRRRPLDSDSGVRSHGLPIPNPSPVHGGERPTAAVQALAQLPPDVADFTGQEHAFERVRRLLERASASPSAGKGDAVMVVAIAGKPGVGKTALAVHVAHHVRPSFPDGQLYVDLRGAETVPLDPARVLLDLLQALGVADTAIPDGLEARARLYRSRLADHCVLVVLDNAGAEAQIRPLLPGSAGCAVLLTSRARLAGLDAAHLVDLDVLPSTQAVALLSKIVGHARVTAEAQAAQRIVEHCGYLPLAIRIAGARLATRPLWQLKRLEERLADEQRRLSELTARDREVRASFALSYSSLGDDERRAFRRLGLVSGADFAAWVCVPLMDIDLPQAHEMVERLADTHLLDAAGEDVTGQLRYRYHDLLRLFAREQLHAEESASMHATALKRLITAYLNLARQASTRVIHTHTLRLPDMSHDPEDDASSGHENNGQRLTPAGGQAAGLTVPGMLRDPWAWFASERQALVTAVEQAHLAGWWSLTYELAASSAEFFDLPYLDDMRHINELALDAADRAGDPHVQATTLHNLGLAYRGQGRPDDAQRCLEQALAEFRDLTDRRGEASTLHHLGIVHQSEDEWPTAVTFQTQALTLFREVGDRRGEASTLRSLGILFQLQGRLPDAVACLEQSLQGLREVGDHDEELYALGWLGRAYADQGRFDDAIACLEMARGMTHSVSPKHAAARTLLHLGRAYRLQRRFDDAQHRLSECRQIFRAIDDGNCEAIAWRESGEAYLAQQLFDDARRAYQQSLSAHRAGRAGASVRSRAARTGRPRADRSPRRPGRPRQPGH